jgi:hypothetical protein
MILQRKRGGGFLSLIYTASMDRHGAHIKTFYFCYELSICYSRFVNSNIFIDGRRFRNTGPRTGTDTSVGGGGLAGGVAVISEARTVCGTAADHTGKPGWIRITRP